VNTLPNDKTDASTQRDEKHMRGKPLNKFSKLVENTTELIIEK